MDMPFNLPSINASPKTIFLALLILLNVFFFLIFDTFAMMSGPGDGSLTLPSIFNAVQKLGWFIDPGNILRLLNNEYSLEFCISIAGNYYHDNLFIIDKAIIAFLSAIFIAYAYKFVPDLLPVCYGYLSGMAVISAYNGFFRLINGPSGSTSHIIRESNETFPGLVLLLCILAGVFISLLRFLSKIDMSKFYEWSGSFIKSQTVAKASTAAKKEMPEDYKEKVKELVNIDHNEAVQAERLYETVNEMAEKYQVERSEILYDVYKEKNKTDVVRKTN